MSAHEHENENTAGIPDEQLPPDLVAGEDNPLAEGLPDGEGSGPGRSARRRACHGRRDRVPSLDR